MMQKKENFVNAYIQERLTPTQQNVKTLITEQNEILLLYSDPNQSTGNLAKVTKFGGIAGTSEISLNVLTLDKEYSRFFEKHDPALLSDETIFL